jgi:hypothetical protein
LFLVTTLQAQDHRAVTPAPVPTQIVTAKKVFISNLGSDALATPDFKRLGQLDLPYQRFYSEMKGWGRYELVTSPAEADLVFEVHFSSPLSDCGKVTSYLPQFEILNSRRQDALCPLDTDCARARGNSASDL